ncbi:MAG TPA: hypothetical protein VGR35_08755 [Tepidisphaeraceae bacterium]|nr:hypothetical protein [Tepidisphaeraceae bacterium]
MSVLEQLAESFPADSVLRGDNYYRSAVVRIDSMTKNRVRATVGGSKRYRVELQHYGDAFDYSCTCPYSGEHGEGCLHVWATLRAAEEQDWLALSGEDDSHTNPLVRLLNPVFRSIPAAARAQLKGQFQPWKRALNSAKEAMRYSVPAPAAPASPAWPAGREVLYVIDATPDPYQQTVPRQVVVETYTHQPRKDGAPGKLKATTITDWEWVTAPDPQDRLIGQALLGAERNAYYSDISRRFTIPGWAYNTTLRAICQTGRCLLRTAPPPREMRPLQWDDGEPWEFFIEVKPDTPSFRAYGAMRRGEQRMALEESVLATTDGLLIARDHIGRFDHRGALPLMHAMRQSGPLAVPSSGLSDFLKTLYDLPAVPSIEWPADARVTEVRLPPCPVLKLKAPTSGQGSFLFGELLFDYGDACIIEADRAGAAGVDQKQRRVVVRDLSAERDARQRLNAMDVRQEWTSRGQKLRIAPAHLPRVVSQLTPLNWRIEAEGKLYRTPGEIDVSVSSGIDWFELNGTVAYGDQTVALPKLLAALERGANTVVLDDGSIGAARGVARQVRPARADGPG